jgi:signal transduction histidine kinase
MACAEALRPRSLDGRLLLAGNWDRSAALPSVRGVPERELTVAGVAGDVRVRATARYLRDGAGRVCGAVLSLRPTDRPGGAATGAEVVSTVSHELRAPLTSIKGYTSLLLSRWERLTDDQKRMMLEQVHADADRVTRLIGELLDISRLETGRMALRRQLVDLPALVATVVEKAALAEADLECAVTLPDDLPPVSADADKLEQVLTNLVENAAKYASPKGIEIGARCGDGFVAVSVRDHGEGIPPSELPRVFRKFYRGGHGRPSGTGLGLWISRGLVEAHGGRLTAESTPGQGSTFTFTLPLAADAAAN